MATRYNPKIVTDGLVLALDAANTRSYPGSGNNIDDLSTNKIDPITKTSGITFSSNNKGFFNFDSTSEYIEMQETSSITPSEMTLSTWVNATAMTPERMIARSNDQSSENDGWRFLGSSFKGGDGSGSSNTGTQWGFRPAPSVQERTSGEVLPLNSWQNLVVSHGVSNELKLYRNGELKNTILSVGNLGFTGYIRIGEGTGGAQEHWYGGIANFIMYNRALTASEIAQNYNALKGRFGL